MKHKTIARNRAFSLVGTCMMLTIVGMGGVSVGQGLGGSPSAHGVEFGVGREYIHRMVRYSTGEKQEADWGRDAAFVRLGLTDRITFTVDGWVWHEGSTHDFPKRDYYNMSVGAAIGAAVLRRGDSRVRVAVRYYSCAWIDRSVQRMTKQSQRLTIGAALEQRLELARQELDIWLGPAFIVDWLEQRSPWEEWVNYDSNSKSVNDWGAIVGGSIRLKGHVRLYDQLTFAQYWQGEAGLAVVF